MFRVTTCRDRVWENQIIYYLVTRTHIYKSQIQICALCATGPRNTSTLYLEAWSRIEKFPQTVRSARKDMKRCTYIWLITGDTYRETLCGRIR